ncbi:hypothetical protein ACRAKI_21375 [Saccharothrix isguenensis]
MRAAAPREAMISAAITVMSAKRDGSAARPARTWESRSGRPSSAARLGWWCGPPRGTLLREVEEAARRWLSGDGPRPDNAVYRDHPLTAEVALAFGNAATAYRGMGADLLLAFHDLVTDLEDRYGPVHDLLDRTPGADSVLPRAFRQMWVPERSLVCTAG